MAWTLKNFDPQQEFIIGAAYGDIDQMTAALARGAQLDVAIPLVEGGHISSKLICPKTVRSDR